MKMQRKWRRAWQRGKPHWAYIRQQKARGQGRCRRLARWTSPAAAAAVAAALLLGDYSGSNTALAQQIVIDGKTQTALTVNGKITDITTDTIRGRNAFNSFTRFNIDSGNIVNLQLPTGTLNLLNLVNGERSTINGMLNSIKDGRIGGNVYFLNPYGILVGSTGIVNVGSLTMATPTKGFMDSFFTSANNPSDLAANAVLSGAVPITADGSISVHGKINANKDITISAGNITNSGVIAGGANFVGNQPDFSDIVNSNALQSGNKLVVENGVIQLIATGNVVNSGIIANDGGSGVKAGNITITAGHDITIGDSSLVSARGFGANSAGGTIYSYAQNNAVFNNGAVIDVSGGEVSGDAGYLEFSAKKTVTLNGGTFKALTVNGKAGSVLIDPEDITVNSGAPTYIISGGPVSLEATKSITLNSGSIISSRNIGGSADYLNAYSVGASGNISLNAPTITVSDGAGIYSHVLMNPIGYTTSSTSYKAGDISFTGKNITLGKAKVLSHTAVSNSWSNTITPYNALSGDIIVTAKGIDQNPLSRIANADSSIDVNGATIMGRNIALKAETEASYDWSGGSGSIVTAVSDQVPSLALFGLTGIDVGLAVAKGSATVNVNAGTLDAVGAATYDLTKGAWAQQRGLVDLSATTASSASSLKLGVSSFTTNDWFNVGFVYGQTEAVSTVAIKNTAVINGADLKVSALNRADLNVSVIGMSNDTVLNSAIAVTDANVTSSAKIDGGATLNLDNSVAITALNTSSFSTGATAMALETGKVGVGIAVSNLTTDATAANNANVTTGSLTVNAVNTILKNKVTSGGTAGTGFVVGKTLVPLLKAVDSAVDKLATKMGKAPALHETTGASTPKAAASVTFTDNTHKAAASIGDNVHVDADKDVVVYANVTDAMIRTQADSSVNGEANNPDNPGAKLALSAAVDIGLFTHDAKANVGQGAQINAQNLGVRSGVSLPYEISWAKWDGVSSIISKINGNLGLADGFVTGYANAGSSTTGLGLAGAINNFQFTNTSQASIDRSAHIIVKPGSTGNWSVSLPKQVKANKDIQNETLNWSTPVSVTANTDVAGVFVAGNMSLILNGAGGDPGATSVGGAYGQVKYLNTTKAYVAEGAIIEQQDGEAAPDVSIMANSTSNLVSITPTTGRGTTYGVNAIFSLTDITDKTEASVDDEAQVKSKHLTIHAQENLIDWALAGAFTKADGAGVGAGVAINDASSDTKAFVGDNDSNNSDGSHLTRTDGKVTATGVVINARTDGRIEAIGVAGALASSSDPMEPQGKISAKLTKAKEAITSLVSKTPGGGGGAPAQSSPGFGLAVSGSSSVNLIDLDTHAYTDGANISLDTSGVTSLNVSAVNNTDVMAVGGSASLVRANNPSSTWSAGVAGSLALNDVDNTTEAYIKGSTLSNAQDVNVIALTGGEQLAIAIGATVNASANQTKSASVAGSVSISTLSNTTSARVENNSMLTGQSTGAGRTVNIDAYDTLKLGSGGGSLAAGGRAGIGAAVSYSSVTNTTEAKLNNSTISEYDDLNVHAQTAAKIAAGGGMGAFSTTDHSATFGGAFVYSDIGNTVDAVIDQSTATVSNNVDVLAADTTGIASYNSIIESSNGGNPASATLDYNGAAIGETSGAGSSIVSVAGVVQAGKNNLGVSFAYNNIHNEFSAEVVDTAITAGGQVGIEAKSDASIFAAAVGVGIATDKFAGSGSLTKNEINNTINASAESTTNKKIAATTLKVNAEDDSSIKSLAGSVTISTGNTAIGAAVGMNTVGNKTTASIKGIDFDAHHSTLVTASNDSDISTLSATAGGSESFAFNGSEATSTIKNTTESSIVNSKSTNSNNDVTVTADDTADIRSLSGAVAISGKTAAGAAVSVNSISDTTEAHVSGSSGLSGLNVNNLLIHSTSGGEIKTLAAGAAIGGNAALGGSLVTNTMGNTTKAYIDSGAIVMADGNIGVLAENNDSVQVVGGAAGIGLETTGAGITVVINNMEGSTEAYISGVATKVDAKGASLTPLQVNSGQLVTPIDVSTVEAPSSTTPSLSETQTAVTGLAVVATSHQAVVANAVTLGVGAGPGVSLVPITNLMGGKTHAYIDDGAKIDTTLTDFAAPQVYVNASSHSYAGNFIVGASGGTFAATGAASTNKLQRKTYADITNATVGNLLTSETTTSITTYHPEESGATGDGSTGVEVDPDPSAPPDIPTNTVVKTTKTLKPAVGLVSVNAQGSQHAASIVAGFAVGIGNGVAGTGVINLFEGDVQAGVKGGSVAANGLSVTADLTSGYNALAGAGAFGTTGGGAGTFVVGISHNNTEAYIGDDEAGSTTNTTLSLAGDISVTANTDNRFNSILASGAIGGTAGIAGMADVTIINNTTNAGLYRVTAGTVAPAAAPSAPVTVTVGNDTTTTTIYDNTASGLIGLPIGDVAVEATEKVKIRAYSGALGGGLTAGVGAGANVVILKSQVNSQAIDSQITTPGNFDITADSNKDIKTVTATAGVGGIAGIGGAASIILIGSGNTGDAMRELDKDDSGTLSAVDSYSASTYSVMDVLTNDIDDGVTAKIAGSMVAADSVNVNANASTSTDNTVGAAGVGLVGVGGAVGYTRVYDNVSSIITQSVITAPTVSVAATMQDGTSPSAKVTTYAGAAGSVGLGAAVADAVVDNIITATIDGTLTGDGSSTSDLTVNASDASTVKTEALGATLGAAAAGVVVSDASKSSEVQALVLSPTVLTKYHSVNITASSATLPEHDMVSAKAIGAAGGLLYAGNGAVAIASNSTDVSALTGSGVALPEGDVTILAINTSHQNAKATGVAGAGIIAASGAVATAESDNKTTVLLGDDAQNTGIMGNLTIMAIGSDTNLAEATAGSGGVAAGNASIANTNSTSTVSATLGTGIDLSASKIIIDAEHQDKYFAQADSVNAAIVGGSGAVSTSDLDSTVNATIGNDVKLSSLGTVTLAANNSFATSQQGNNASGAGGGVLNGAAAVSSTDITGTTNVLLGDDVKITSGLDAVAMPGGISVVANSYLSAIDQVVLKTGGAIAGAGSDSRITASLDNNINTGLRDTLQSQGNINIGTYTNASANTSAYVNTWGVAAVGYAVAKTDIETNQKVAIGGGGSKITAFGNVNITAGEAPDGSDSTTLNGSASAQGYVRGLIAVPGADADTTLTSNATLDIQSGTTVESGQNVTIGAYHGTPQATADGTGHGYELGFIPVTTGDSDTSTPVLAAVTQNGTITAGMYHDLEIAIHNGTFTKISGAPVGYLYNPLYNLNEYINQHYDATAANVLLNGMPSIAPAYTLGTLFAAGGTITVNADTLSGNGALTSYGAPKITVRNTGTDSLILGDIKIPNQPGAKVIFTGNAGSSQYHGAITKVGLDASGNEKSPQVIVNNSYEGAISGQTTGPAILLSGNVENLGGSITINNTSGAVGQAASILGQIVSITVPSGPYVVSMPDSYYVSGENPYSLWKNSMIWPGGNPANGVPNANWGIVYVANATYNANGQYGTSGSATENSNLMYALLGKFAHYQPDESQVLLGKGLAGVPNYDLSGQAYAKSLSPVGQAYSIAKTNYDNMWFPVIPTVALTKTINTYSPAILDTAGASAIQAKNVLINAKYIDINSKITVGQNTDWSLSLDANLGQQLKAFKSSNPGGVYTIPLKTVLGTDSGISAKYDARSNQIIVQDNLIAAAGGASITLNGAIISSNPLGKIHVNGGLGEVTIENETGIPITIQSVNTGNTSLGQTLASSVDINDSLTQRQTLYSYIPGTGLSIYAGAYVANPDNLATPDKLTGLTLVSSSATNSAATFNPYTGIAWQWQQRASLSRNISPWKNFSVGNWVWNFPTGQPNNPWQYLTQRQNQIGSLPASGSSGSLTTTPQGRLIVQSEGSPAFQQTITGYYSGYVNTPYIIYHGSYGLSGDTRWAYYYPTNANLTMTMTAKADNPIGIDFSGNARGMVSITSNAAVLLSSKVINPDGDTSVIVTGAGNGIQQTKAASILTNNLNLNSAAGIGSKAKVVAATLTQGGVLTASGSKDGIYLNLNSGAVIDQIVAGNVANGYGDVIIDAAGSLVPKSGTAINVTGSNITLSTTTGSIGSSAASLVISANEAALANDGTLGGVVNISAPNNISIKEVAGNLLVGQIKSTASGNVSLDVPNGAIYNASGQTAAQSLSPAQVAQISQTLGLTVADGAETGKATDATVATFETTVNRYYQQYWQLRNQGTVDANGQLTLSASGVTLLTPLAAAALGSANPTVVEVQTYANQLFQTDRSFLGIVKANGVPDASTERVSTTVIPVKIENLSDFMTYNPGFKYTATAEQISALTSHAVWTEAELTNAISRSALTPSGSTPVGDATPNIVGRDIAISAGYAIGKLASPMIIDLAAFQNGTLTQEQKAAIALAKTPGDVLGVGKDALGKQVVFSFTVKDGNLATPAGITLTGFQLTQTAPIYVDAAGKITALASQKGTSSSLYLQGAGVSRSLSLDQISALGDINLTTPQNITVAVDNLNNPLSSYQLKGRNITLLSGSGSIGSETKPLVYWTNGGNLTLATAGQNLYLKNFVGNMLLGSIAAGNDVWLNSAYGDMLAADPNTVTVQGKKITLLTGATDNIGTNIAPLRIQTALDGYLTGAAGGSATIYSPSTSLPLSIDTFTVGGNLSLTAYGDLTAKRLTAASGSITAAAGNKLSVDQLNSLEDTLTALGNAAIGNVSTTSGGTISITAGQTVSLTGQVETDGTVEIHAGNEITEEKAAGATAAGSISANLLTTGSLGGQSLKGANEVTNLNAANTGAGDFEFTNTAGQLTINGLSVANGNVTVTTGGDLIVNTTLQTAADKNITLTAAGSETIKAAVTAADIALTATGAASDIIIQAAVSSTGGDITAIAGRNITAGNEVAAVQGAVTLNAQSGAIGASDKISGHSAVNLAAAKGIIGSTINSDAGNVILTAGEGMIITDIAAATGADLQTATGDVSVGATIATGGDININAVIGSIYFNAFTAAQGAVNLTTAGDILNAASAPASSITANSVTLTTAGGIGTVINPLTINSSHTTAGTVTATAHDSIYLRETAGDLHVDQIQSANGDLVLTADQSLLNQAGSSVTNLIGRNLDLTATHGSIGTSADHIAINTAAAGMVTATAHDSIYLRETAGDFHVNQIQSALGNVSLITAQNLSADRVTAGANITLTAAGSLALGQAVAAVGSVSATAGQHIMLSGVVSANPVGAVSLIAGGTITEQGAGAIETQTLATVSSGGQILTGANKFGRFNASNGDSGGIALTNTAERLIVDTISQLGGDVTIQNSGDIAVGKIAATQGTVGLDAAKAIISANSAGAASNIDAVSISLMARDGGIGAVSRHLYIDSSNASTGTAKANATGDIYLTELNGNLNIGQIQSAAGDINLIADGSILNANSGGINLTGNNLAVTSHNGSIGAAGNRLALVVPGAVDAHALGDIQIEARSGDLNATNLVSRQGGINLLVVDGSANIGQSSAPGGTVIIGATAGIAIDYLKAQTLEFNTPDAGSTLRLGTVVLGQGMKAASDNISIGRIEHFGGPAPLLLAVTGGSKDMADTVDIGARSDVGVVFTTFAADRSNVQANADNVSFLDTRVGSWANFRNNRYYVAANNLERRLIPSDLQIMPENNAFYLTMFADHQFRTNALVINYSPDFIVNGASNDNSLIRQADKLNAQSSNGSDSIGSPDQIGQFTLPRFSNSASGSQLLLPGLVTGFSNGLGTAVNLGNKDNTSSPGTGETREEEKDNQ